MEKMEGKTESLETVNENNGKLCSELDQLVTKLQVSYEHQQILQVRQMLLFLICSCSSSSTSQEADFSNPEDLDKVVEAAWALATAILAPIPYTHTRCAAPCYSFF